MAGPLRDPSPGALDRIKAVSSDADDGPVAGGSDASPAVVEPLPDAPVDAIEEWTLDQLHRRASEVDLEGRWEMSREQLIEALRETP